MKTLKITKKIKDHITLFIFLQLSILAFSQNGGDDCLTATNLPNVNNFCSANSQYNNTSQAVSSFNPPACWTDENNDLWFTFTATDPDLVVTVLGNGYSNNTLQDPQIALYSGTCALIINEGCATTTTTADSTTLNAGGLIPGNLYYIRVDGTNNAQGTFQMCVNNFTNTGPVPNDECENAEVLTDVDAFCSNQAQYSNVGMTGGGFGAPACWNSTTNDVWFSFTAAGPQLEIEVYGNGFGTNTLQQPQIAVYSGACAAVILTEGCAIYPAATDSASLNIGGLTTGDTYLIRIDGDNGNTGTFQLCVNSYNPPVVTGQDCDIARRLCNKNSILESSVVGFGADGDEAANSCLAAGVNGGGLTEQNSAWYTWTAADNGTITFDITPLASNPNLDVDFVLYQFDPITGCQGRTQIRCMGASCPGATGLNATSVDQVEPPDCLPPNDNYLQELTQVAGTTYGLLVNNFQVGANGYTIDFGGTGEFTGAEADFTATHVNNCTFPKTIDITDNSTGADSYAWDFGAGANPPTATTAGPHSIAYNTPGIKDIELTVTSADGCESTMIVSVDIPDTMDLTAATVASTCEQPNGEVTVTATGGNGAVSNFMYSLDGGAQQASNSFTGLTPGSHTVTVFDSIACQKDIVFDIQTTLVPDVDDIADVSACGNYTLPNISGTNLTGNESYYTGPGATGTALTPGTIITTNQTIYIHDSTTTTPSCMDEEDFTVTINSAPVVTNIVENCDGTATNYTVSFDVSGGDGGPYTVTEIAPGGVGGTFTGNTWTSNNIPSAVAYQFNVDDANNCGPIAISGSRNCSCVTSAGSMDPALIEVCGTATTTATYNNATESNDGNDAVTFVLHDNSGGTLGNVLQTNNTAPTFGFQAPMVYGTTYYISATIGNDNGGSADPTDPCFDVAAGTPVVWYETPTADFTGTATICQGESTDLTFTFTGVGPFTITYTDGTNNFNVTNLSTGSTVSVSPNTTTTYSLVSVVSSGTTCAGTVAATTQTVTVNTPPSATIPVYTCNATNTGYTASFDVSGGTGGPYTVNELQPGMIGGAFNGNTYTTNEIPNGTIFQLEVDDNNNCGPIIVSGVENCTCASDAGSMSNQTIEICGTGPATANHDQTNMNLDGDDVLEYVLHDNSSNFLGNVLQTNGTPTFSFMAPMTYGTTYYISAIVGNDDGNGNVDQADPCLSVAVGTPVVWNENPTTTASATSTQICAGESIELFATTSPGAFYSWDGPLFFSSTDQNPTRPNATTGMSGTYTVTVTTSNGCSSSSDVNITVNPSPNASINSDPADPFCEDEPEVTLTAVSPGGTWSGNGITDANAGTFDPSVAGPGTHTISYDIQGNCPSTGTRDIVVNATPAVDFTPVPSNGCDPLDVRFYNTTGASDEVLWDFGDGGVFNSTTVVDSIDRTYTTGTYNLTLTVTTNGCVGTATQNGAVTVNPAPTASFTAIKSGTTGTYTMNNTSISGSTYLWDFGNGETSTELNPTIEYGSSAGSYTIVLRTFSDQGCVDSTSFNVTVEEDVIFFVPNTFTPNGDANNQYFEPVMTSGFDPTTYVFKVYNRWGEVIFESNDINVGWDGTYQNTMAPSGMYQWTIQFRNMNTDQKYSYQGSVNLLR